MKKKIIIGLSVFSLVFLIISAYILISIETTTSKLDNLITLHQVEILREHLLIQIATIQSDLKLKDRDNAAVLSGINVITQVSDKCFDCHHSNEVVRKLTNIRNLISNYKKEVTSIIITGGDRDGSSMMVENAFGIGENLIHDVNNMISMTSIKLDEKTQNALQKMAQTKKILFAVIIAGPIIATVLAFIFIRAFTKPLGILLNATRSFKSGDMSFRVETLKDEFGEVGASLNEMAGSLKEQIRNIQRTEQLRVTGELATGLAHEIKNPLTGIKVSMEVLAEDSGVSSDVRKILLKVVDEVRRIESLLKKLLNFAKPPQAQFTLTNINNILDISMTFSVRIPSIASSGPKAIVINKNFDDSIPLIMADQMQLQQVFLNLLLNAVDAMPDGGTLTVATRYMKDGLLQIVISDTGKGIPAEKLDRIFQPFFTSKTKGTGMGLAISRRIVEEHGGSISVDSSPDKGTAFIIVFPAGKV